MINNSLIGGEMSFLTTIKNALHDERHRRGSQGHTLVPTRALIELVEHFERLDNERRLDCDHTKQDPWRILFSSLCLCYQLEKDEGKLWLFIMDTLKPLIQERIKVDMIKRAERPSVVAEPQKVSIFP